VAFLSALKNDVSLSFFFVNDGSTDETSNILNILKEQNPAQVEVMNLEKNSGKVDVCARGCLHHWTGGLIMSATEMPIWRHPLPK